LSNCPAALRYTLGAHHVSNFSFHKVKSKEMSLGKFGKEEQAIFIMPMNPLAAILKISAAASATGILLVK